MSKRFPLTLKRNDWLGSRSGFSIVEVILAVAVFVMIISVLTSALMYGEESTMLSGTRARAVFLAEEGLEAARNIRDASFSNITLGVHGLATSGQQWVFSGTSDTTDIFSRQLTVSDVSSNTKRVTAAVTWQQNPQRTGAVMLATYFTNWLASSSPLAGTRISYYDATGKNLNYATCDASCAIAGNWTKIAPDTTGTVGQYGSLAFDIEKPRISYYDNTNNKLKYASCDANCTVAGNWTLVTVDPTTNRGQYTSLAIDSGTPRIAYYDVTQDDLRYASCDANCTVAGNWTLVAIDTVGTVGEYASTNK